MLFWNSLAFLMIQRMLVLLGTVNLQFWGALVPISVHQFSKLWHICQTQGYLIVGIFVSQAGLEECGHLCKVCGEWNG